jgi:hypothetical protein
MIWNNICVLHHFIENKYKGEWKVANVIYGCWLVHSIVQEH